MNKICYHVSPVNPKAHLFYVSMTFTPESVDTADLTLPSWIPGSYMIRDFAKNIVTLTASDNSGPLKTQKTDKQTWRIEHNRQEITVEYQVYAWDLSVRAAHLDDTHGFFNGTSLFFAVLGQQNCPCEVQIQRPQGDAYQDWKVATGLQRAEHTSIFDFGLYLADDYQQLIDCPVEMADFSHISFEAHGINHYMIFTGKHYGDLARVAGDVKKLCEHHLDLFGKPNDLTEYWFLTYVTDTGFGGLEHCNSTALICSRFDLPSANLPESLDEGYKTFLSLCSHEYFHTWNVKRLKPKNFLPYELSSESYTDQLWAYEGITSYYDDLSLLRTKLIDSDGYFRLLEKTISRVYRSTGRLKQTVAESSFDAWTKFYKQDENANNAIISYYTKGALIALCLDLTLRTQGKGKSLDDVMQTLWQRHGATPSGTVYEDFIAAFNLHSEHPIDQQLQQFVYSTDDLPIQSLLAQVGVTLNFRQGKDPQDFSGIKSDDEYLPALEANYKNSPAGLVLTQVFDNGAAQLAGLSAQDTLLAIDNVKVTNANLRQLLNNIPKDTQVTATIFRQDALMSFPLTLKPAIEHVAQLSIENADKTAIWWSFADNINS